MSDIDRAAEQARDRDVDDSAEGTGAWQSSPFDEPKLSETFLASTDAFRELFPDSITDHSELQYEVFRCYMVCIANMRKNIDAQGKRGDFLSLSSSIRKLDQYHADLGREMFDVVTKWVKQMEKKS